MKKRYKNKRDQYKAERDQFQRENITLKRQIETAKKDKSESLLCTIYCSHCQKVYGATVPKGCTIKGSGCACCGIKDVGYLVTEVKRSARYG